MFTNKRVLFLTTTDNMIWQFLLPHIKQLQDAGNIVECACAKTGFWFDELKDKNNLVLHEIKFARNPISPKNIKGYKTLKNLVKEKKYDLIHCHQPVGGVMGRLVANKFKIPVIYTAHGFHFYKGAPIVNVLIYKTIEKYLSKKTDVLITMNEEDFRSAKKFRAKNVYKISGVGVDLSKYKKTKENAALKKELGIRDNDFVLLSVGELNDNKNHQIVIKALAKTNNDNIKYIICGQGINKEKLINLAKTLDVENQVVFTGFRKDINEIYNIADIFVMPSIREGLPKSQMEAMAFGLPVIASDIRGCKDLIKNDEGGFLVNPNSAEEFATAISSINQNTKMIEAYKNRNLEYIKKFSTENVLKEMEEIYKEMRMV